MRAADINGIFDAFQETEYEMFYTGFFARIYQIFSLLWNEIIEIKIKI